MKIKLLIFFFILSVVSAFSMENFRLNSEEQGSVIVEKKYEMPTIKLGESSVYVNLKKISNGEISGYFYSFYFIAQSNYRNCTIEESELILLLNGLNKLMLESVQQNSSSMSYYNVKDLLTIGYTITNGNIEWFIKLNKFYTNNILFFKDVNKFYDSLESGLAKMKEMKKN